MTNTNRCAFPLAHAVITAATSPVDWRRAAADLAARREDHLRSHARRLAPVPSIYG